MAKLAQHEVNAELVLFSRAANTVYNTDSFAAGYYEALLARLISELPKHKQATEVQMLRIATAKLEQNK